VDQDSFLAIKRTGYKIFIGLPHREELRSWKILRRNTKKKELWQTQYPRIQSLRGTEVEHPIPQNDHRGAADVKEETPPSIKFISADKGIPSKGTWSDKKEKAKEGMETDPSPSK
jgi:hypothetical protein